MTADCDRCLPRFIFRRVLASILMGGLYFLTAPCLATADEADKSFKRALELHKKGDFEEAKRKLEDSLRLKSDHRKARALLGLICFEIGEKHKDEGNIPQALMAFQEAVDTDPEEAYWHAALSRAMQAAGDTENATKECTEAARLSPLDALLQAGCRPPEAVAEVLPGDKVPPEASKFGIWAPSPVRKPEPPYCEKARQVLHQGVTKLYILVNAQGDVSGMAVIKPLGLGLDQEALKTISTWKFNPAKLNGAPIGVRIITEVHFRLH